MRFDWEQTEKYVYSVANKIFSRHLSDLAPEGAEDLAQDALLRVWEHRDRFDKTKCSWNTWLYRSIWWVALNKLSKLRRMRRKMDLFRREFEGVGEAADFDLEREYEVAFLAYAALCALRPRERLVLVAVDCEGLTLEEVGTELGLTKARVGQIRLKALQKARRAITVTIRRRKERDDERGKVWVRQQDRCARPRTGWGSEGDPSSRERRSE